MKYGCDLVPVLYEEKSIDLCSAEGNGYYIRPIATFCPVTCGCGDPKSAVDPKYCPSCSKVTTQPRITTADMPPTYVAFLKSELNACVAGPCMQHQAHSHASDGKGKGLRS